MVPLFAIVPFTFRSVPAPSAMVNVTPLFTVIWPPVFTVVSSVEMLLVTVTVWPFWMVIAPSALVGVEVAFVQVAPSSTDCSHARH